MDRLWFLKRGALVAVLMCCSACSSMGRVLNPFYESPSPVAYMGEKNDRAISGGTQKVEKARDALEAAGNYQRAHDPAPYKPVMNPSVVRVMWIPDHLTQDNNLVPAHFFYLKVRDDYFGVTDAFELEQQLDASGAGKTSNVPYVHQGDAY